MTAQHIINHIEFSRKSQKIHDTIALSFFSRLSSQLVSTDATVTWSLEGQAASPENDRPRLILNMVADMQLLCQRCLKPMPYTINQAQIFELVNDEAEIPLDDHPQHDYLVISPAFDVLQLIEDELILVLPYAPKHDAECKPDGVEDFKQANSAFAVLKNLRN